MQAVRTLLILGVALCGRPSARAQIDPMKRELIQLGYSQPIQGKAPLSGYAFYYLNVPQFHYTNLTVRLAVAPVYLDSEAGISQALGPNTDVAIGLAGGGFADSYAEIRRGDFVEEESFLGHGGGGSFNLYHRFNPSGQIPLNGVLRSEVRYVVYEEDSDTDDAFELPDDGLTFHLRTGLRWGGREPLIRPDVGMELSAWYEGQYRTWSGHYGFNGDRSVRNGSHLLWARGLFTYTLPKLKHHFNVNLTLGTSASADRFSAYRLGGILPLTSEFPLTLPGYYFQEISARRFVLFGGSYAIPLDQKKRWSVIGEAATAGVDYVPGLTQPGRWHSGAGAGIVYRSRSDSWQLVLSYGYGIDALRHGDRGAHSIGFLLQFDLDQAKVSMFEPGENPVRSRGLQRLFQQF
jgi:hypothetical protein